MSVYKRDYTSPETRKAVWYYQFQWMKQTFKASGFLTEKEAAEAEGKKKRELRSEERHVVPLQRATLQEFIPLYLQHRATTHAETTTKREDRRVRPIVACLGKKVIRSITVGDIHAYVAKRKNKDGLANRTINLELNSLRCMFRYAEELGYAGVNPAKTVKNLRETLTVEHWIPKPEELARFAAEAGKTYSGEVLVTWIWFMAYTGTRPREALFVEWPDIDFEHNRILIRPKPGNPLKNGRSRYVDLHPELRTRMLAWRVVWNATFERRARRHPDEESPPHQWVFYNPHGQRARAESFLRGFQIARDKAGLPQMTPYTLRHFFISYCVMKEIPMLTITRWVGHTSSKMIEQVYGHLSPAFTAQQMRRFSIEPTAPAKAEPSA